MRQPAYNIGTRACAALLGSMLAAGLLIALFSPQAQAQEQEDPGFVVSRTVMPRIAYRGVPLEDNPVHTRATTFPAKVFHSTLDNALGNALGDGELSAATGSGGLVMQATRGMLVPDAQAGGAGMGLMGSATGSAPLGMGASVGGSVRGATEGLGNTITGALSGAMSSTGTGAPGSKP
ncbi:hypothetical protein IP90_03095 [Luteimonas cucumeris]|uniref:Uncharacterized protein n=1 Tax=Luteimonas cucumeris TaxID=985012 RepID=A0A562KVP3_9GAMM|nr:hypothetical protein [Luteimonas cucumeris]TWH99480.1 hypothetical protein IP90_03095 [Luteimonas cucumeris]